MELRHRRWSDDENTARLLQESNVSWVQIDESKFRSLIAAEVPMTSDFAFFNNHWQGFAPRSAVDLQKSLQLPLKELPVIRESLEDERK